jgi:hypothetical protein
MRAAECAQLTASCPLLNPGCSLWQIVFTQPHPLVEMKSLRSLQFFPSESKTAAGSPVLSNMAEAPAKTGGDILQATGAELVTKLVTAAVSSPVKSKKNKYISLDAHNANPANEKIESGMDHVAIAKRVSTDGSLSYEFDRREAGADDAKVKRLASDAYIAMRELYLQEFPKDVTCLKMPASVAAIGDTKAGHVRFASSILGGPATKAVHASLAAHGPHARGFSCAEMQAVNDVFLVGLSPTGMTIKTVGNPDGSQTGRGIDAGKIIMLPCTTKNGNNGCKQILEALQVKV